MNESYRKLARVLDEMPNGFPPTESGVELKILAALFEPEEAELASSMSLDPEPVSTIAEKNKFDDREAKGLLLGMVKKGLIEVKREPGEGFMFYLMPFVVGFYERQNAKISKEFAELFEQYYKEAFHTVMSVVPSVHRVIPVEKTIPVNIDVMPYERASNYMDDASSYGVLDCICRVQQKLIGKGCEHPVENCLVFSKRPGAFDRTDDIRAIDKEEAIRILDEANEAGLVHSTNNAQEDVWYICNCCTCSCGILRGIVEHGNQNAVARSDFYAGVDEQACTACEDCLERCQFDAMEMGGNTVVINRVNCVGCGLCVTSCASEALSLTQKPGNELTPPPLNDEAWRIKRMQANA